MSGRDLARRLRARRGWPIDVVIGATILFLVALAVQTSRLPLEVTENEEEQRAIHRDIESLRDAVLAYARTEGRLPTEPTALVPRYIDPLPRDPFGRPYVFIGGGSDLVWIFCLGRDGERKRYPPDIGTAVHLADAR